MHVIARLVSVLLLVMSAPLPARTGHCAMQRPIDGRILFLSQHDRDRRFGAMECYYTGHVVRAGAHPQPLPRSRGLSLRRGAVDRFMTAAHVAGLIVLQDGRVRLERYAPGRGPHDRWTSFSVAKSVTSTLVGAAIRDGAIGAVDDAVTRYLPALAGSGYDGVTIAQLLSMRSGVRWNEDYADPSADVVRLYADGTASGGDRTVDYMRRLPRAAAPGTRWNYDTGETDLAGALVAAATHRSLADYLSAAIWRRYGMADDAYWLTDAQGREAGGSGLSMTLRDAARFGQLALEGGAGIVPAAWFETATRPASIIDTAGDGYGYLWWTYPGGRFAARGIFGQSILVDRPTRTVIAIAADWPHPTDPALSAIRARFETMILSAARASARR